MADCLISLAPNGKFLVETNADVSMFGWETHRKFTSYYMNICWANLVDLHTYKNKVGLDIRYDSLAEPVVDRVREELKKIKAASAFKRMPIDDINDLWEAERFVEIFPKLNALDHQKRMVLWLLELHRGGCYAEQGLGKTIIGMLFLGKLLFENKIRKPLIIAPTALLSETAWFKDISTYSDFSTCDLRDDYSDMRADIAFVNPDKFPAWCFKKVKGAEHSYDKENFFEIMKPDAIFFDESAGLKTHSSYTSKAFMNIARHAKYIALASGVPSPNQIFQFWTQMKILGSVLGDSYTAFEKRYGILKSVGPTQKYFPAKDAEQEIRKRIDPVSYFLPKEGNIELPTRHMVPHYVMLSPDHKQIYDEVEKDYICAIKGTDVNGNKIEGTTVAKHEVVVRMKLIQILNGFSNALDENDEQVVIELPWNPKVDYLDNLLSDILKDPEVKVIIWGRFRWEINNLMKRYETIYNPTKLYGGMGIKGREESLKKWHEDPTCRMMIAHPKSAKYGFTWIHATHYIYLSASEDFDDYAQSRDRVHRYGQTKETYEHKIVCKNTLEPRIWQALVRRTKLDKFIKEYGIETLSIG